MDLTSFPDEVILKIFSYLKIEDLANWTKVSKRFRNICQDKALPYGKMKNISEKTKVVDDSIRDTKGAVRKLKDDVLAWRTSVAASGSQQHHDQLGQAGQPGPSNQPGSSSQLEDLVANTEMEIRKVDAKWDQQQLQQQGKLAASWANQQKPSMQSIQRLLTA